MKVEEKNKINRLMILSIATVMCLSMLVFLPTVSATNIYVPGDYPTIQGAVNAANPGDTIIVAAGTYNEMVSINKPITLLGANAGIHPTVGIHPTETVGTRGSETILSHNSLYAINPAADHITIDGFKFTGTGGRIIDTYANANYFSLMNCIFDNPGSHSTTGNIQFGGGSHTDLLFAYNIFIDGGDWTFYAGGGPFDRMHIIANKFNGYGEAIFWAATPLVDAIVEYNEFDGTYNSVPGDGGAYMNIGQGGNIIIRDNWFHDLFYTGSQVGIINGQVTDNLFENIYPYTGYWGTCFELWGGQYGTAISSNVIMERNDFYYNDISGATAPTHGLRLRAPESGSGIDGSTIHVHDNNFYDGGIRTDAHAIWHQASGSVDALCNWWSATSGPYDLLGIVDFDPWYDSPYPGGNCGCTPDIPAIPGYDPSADFNGGARWRNFKMDGNGWELAVGDPDVIGTYNPGWANYDFVYAGDYYFNPAGPNIFAFSYDATTGIQTVSATVNGGMFSKTQNNGNLGTLNYLQLDVVGRDGQNVLFENVVLTVGTSTYNLCDFEAGGWLSWYLNSLDLSGGFSITGNVWLTGQAASQEGGKINIYVGKAGCTPVCRNVEDNIEYCLIQDAVDAVTTTNGETIEVYAGTHYEHVNVYKSLTLQNKTGTTPIIDGTGNGDGFTIAVNGVTIDGFEITNCTNGISSYGTDNSIIKNCIIHDNLNTGYNGAGIMFWSDVADFDNNQILDNEIYNNDRQGIYIGGSYDDAIISNGNTISGNTIYNNGLNTLGNGPDNSCYGIQLSYADSNTIDDNDIYGHIWDYTGSGYWFGQAIYLNNAYLNTVTENLLHNNNYGVVQYTDYTRTKGTNYVNCNKIYDNTEYGIRNYDAVLMDGTCNWWGDCSGPGTIALGTGDHVSSNVDYDPWVGYVIADANGPYTSGNGFVTFDGSGTQTSGCCGETVTYDWDFGDGSPHSNAINPTHQYTQYGVYTVTLTVTVNALGETCQDTDITTVTIPYNIVVDKKVQNGTTWVDNIRVNNGSTVNFRITITNLGGLPLNQVTITDYLSLPQLKYLYNAVPTPTSASDNQVIWTVNIAPGQTITITYSAKAIHVCYGWNSVYLKNTQGTILGYDLTKVKVVNPGQPTLAISTQAWDEGQNIWTDHIGLTLNKNIQFKITISSTALTPLHDVTITDILPLLIAYNNDATLTPTSALPNEITWAIGEVLPGDEIEITFTASTLAMGTEHTTANVASSEGYTDEDYVLLETDSAPTMTLLYPAGGETLKGSINILWNANDIKDGSHLPISLYLKQADGTLSAFAGNPYVNTGELNWDTTSLPDGRYQIQIATQDSNNNVVNVLSSQFQIKNTQTPTENLAPVTPGRPSGSSEGKPGLEYTYYASTVDPEGDQVYYLWDWGDGTTSGWLGPYNSGDTIETPHTWAAKGSYSIKVMAKDSFGLESDWSESLPITMPYTYTPLLQFLENLFERFPNLFPVLRQLFGY